MTLTKYNILGQYQLPPSGGGGGLTDGDYGDITVGGGGTTLTIDAAAVTAGKLGASAIALFEAMGAVATHEGLANPHPVYLTQAEGDALYAILAHGHVAANISDFNAAADGRVAAGIATHVGLADPHTQYLLVTEGDAAYAPLSHVGTGGAAHANVVAAGASGFMTGADKTKLDGIASGATANSADAFLLDRANHTGTQAAGTITGTKTSAFISDFSAAADARVAAGIATHEAAGDPHPGYLTPAEGNAAYSLLGHTHAQADVTGLVAALAAKEPTIAAGTTAQYWRGDKSWQTHDKASVGLANVDNTSDANKPISTATQTALDLKAPLASPTFTGTVGGITKSMVGLGNVDNTSDANKPVSTATQTALNLKLDATHAGTGGAAHANVIAAGAAGFMTGADKTKLDGVATGATANSPDATLLARANHTGTQNLATIGDVTMAVANLNSLDDGVDSALHFHATDRARANHTGTQLSSTISDLVEVIQDMLGTGFIVQGSGMIITYDDAGNTLTFASTGGGGGSTYPQLQSMISLGR
jgi:hypothetical protein